MPTLMFLPVFKVSFIFYCFLLLSGCLGGGSGEIDPTLAAIPKAAKLVLLVSDNNQPADGKSSVTLTVIARDSNNSIVANVLVTLVSSSSTALFSAMSGNTDAQGTFTATATSQVKETVQVYVQADNVRSETANLSFGEQTTDSLRTAKLVLLVSDNNQPADGKSSVTLTVITRDSNNSIVANVPVTLVSSSSTALFSAMSGNTDEQGTFTVTVTSQVKETVQVYVQASNIRSETASLSFGEQTTDSRVAAINVTVENNGQSADGSSAIVLTVVPRDKDNQPVTGIVVSVFSPSDAVLFDKISGNTDERGRFSINATAQMPGTYQVIVRAAGTQANPVEITFLPHLVRANQITLNSSETVLAVNEVANINLIFSYRVVISGSDSQLRYTDTILPNAAFNATVSGSAKLHNVPDTSDNNGAATFTVTDDKAENVTLTVTSALATRTVMLYFGASLELLPKTINTVRQTTLTALLKDGNQSPIPNQAVSFGFTEKNSETLSSNEVLTNSQGLAEVTVTDLGNDGGIATVTARRGTLSAQALVNFKAAFGQNRQLTATTTTNLPNPKAIVTATITDNNGLPIQGQSVKFSSTGTARFSNAAGLSDASGKVTTEVTDSSAEDVVVTIEADTAKQVIPLYFGAKLRFTPDQVDDGIADGKTAVSLIASIENANNQGIAGIPLNLRLKNGQALLSKYYGSSDENGRITLNLTDDFDETVTVEAQTDSLKTATATVKFTTPASKVKRITLTSSLTSLSLNQSTKIMATVLDSQGKPVVGSSVFFTVQGVGTIKPLVATDTSGVAQADFYSATQAGVATIQASVEGVQASLTLIVNPDNAGIIEVNKIDPQVIGIIGSGVAQSSTISFLIKDNLGNVVKDDTMVNFSLGTTTLGGGETISASSNTTHNGLVSVALKSGSVAGNVDVIATVAVENEKSISTSARVTIVGSVPDAKHLSLAAEFLNLAGAVKFGLQNKITAYVGDRFGNIVPDGTGVSFITEGGTIGKSIGGGAFTTTTEFGQATAILQTSEPTAPYLTGCTVPYPSSLTMPQSCGNPGRTTLVAYTSGSESFTDSNGNGQYDSGEPFEDLSEPYIDANENNQFDANELYIDVNKDGKFNNANQQFDANTVIWNSMRILFSGRIGDILVTPATFHLTDGQSQTFTATISDSYGNALVAGTTFTVTTDVDVKIFDKDGKQIDSQTPLGGTFNATTSDSNGTGQTFTFTITNRGYTPQAVNVKVAVTVPASASASGYAETVEQVIQGSFGN